MNKQLSRLFMPRMAVFFIVLAVFCIISWILLPPMVALLETLCALGVFAYFLLMKKHRGDRISQYLVNAGFSTESITDGDLIIPVPAVIVNITGNEIVWGNSAFMELDPNFSNIFDISMAEILPEFSTQWLLDGKKEYPEDISLGNARYRIYGDLLRSRDFESSASTAMLYFINTTDLLDTRDEYNLSRPVVSLILVDNYDDLTGNLSDRAVSKFTAALDDAISAWAGISGGILRKLERNRYLFIFEDRTLPEYIERKFSILDQVRSISTDVGSPPTLSIGIGKEGSSFQENYDYAVLSLEMALSRGGDQAVIKDRYNFAFYGGRAKENERRTVIRSRVISGSMKELIESSPAVYITGHKNADLDAVGAAVGMAAICRKFGKKARIIIDLEHNAAHALLDQLLAHDYYKDSFVSPVNALLTAPDDSLLIVVDTNRPDQVEARSFLDNCSRIAVIDHHRRAADYIDNALANFHEPYASSASELVTELIQNLLDHKDLYEIEVQSLLSGIVLDTKNFTVRTGFRTFEAAAWLKKNGADTVAVKLLFQNDLGATLNRYEILKHAEMYRENIALCPLDYTSDRITAAQAADELLNIHGIEASFVYYPDGDTIFCSARSIGEANVQMILEPLGGGGNQATAGAQIQNKTIIEVTEALKASIDSFFDV